MSVILTEVEKIDVPLDALQNRVLSESPQWNVQPCTLLESNHL